jgi:hypothetical protein
MSRKTTSGKAMEAMKPFPSLCMSSALSVNNLARKKTMATLASSEGCKPKLAKLIQRRAPWAEMPMTATTSRRPAARYMTGRARFSQVL